ncbi:MAG: hypothetical protein KKE94_13035 [Gammaproteobacteria bacterium]|nr:hypothetical protein [Gammaproteobacteria bacterium]
MKENLHLDEKDPLETPVTELGLSNRILKRLAQNDVKVLRHLLLMDSSEISEIRGIGASAINEIDELKKLLNEGYGISDLEVKQQLSPEDVKITKIGLPIRTSSILMENNINTLHDLLESYFENLVKIAGIGSKSLRLIAEIRTRHGKGFESAPPIRVKPSAQLEIMSMPLSLLDIEKDVLDYLLGKSIFTVEDFISFKQVLFQREIDLYPVKRAINIYIIKSMKVITWDDLENVVMFLSTNQVKVVSNEFPCLASLAKMSRSDYFTFLLNTPRCNPPSFIFDFMSLTGFNFTRDISSISEHTLTKLNGLDLVDFSIEKLGFISDYDFFALCKDFYKKLKAKWQSSLVEEIVTINFPKVISDVIYQCCGFLKRRDYAEQFSVKRLKDAVSSLRKIDAIWDVFEDFRESYSSKRNGNPNCMITYQVVVDKKLINVYNFNSPTDALWVISEDYIKTELRCMFNDYVVKRDKSSFYVLKDLIFSLENLDMKNYFSKYIKIYELWPDVLSYINKVKAVDSKYLYKTLAINGSDWKSILIYAEVNGFFERKNGFFISNI